MAIEERIRLLALRVDARFRESAKMQIGRVERDCRSAPTPASDMSSLRKISSQ